MKKIFTFKNPQIQQIAERLWNIFEDQNQPETTRISAYQRLELLKAVSYIYEENRRLDEEDIDDLFIAYGKGIKPIFPEQYPKIIEKIKEDLISLKEKKKGNHSS